MSTGSALRDSIVPLAAAVGLVAALAAPTAVAAQAGQDTAGQAAQGSGVSVADAVVTTGVRDHAPVDTLSTVPADVGRAFLWTRITGAQDSTAVVHAWYRGDQEVAAVELPVNSRDWRTYSTKRILPSWTGPWHVEVRDAGGRVLRTVDFTVRATGQR